MALNDGSGINRSPNKPNQPTGLEYSLLPMFASWLERTQAQEKRGFEREDKDREFAARMQEQELQNTGALNVQKEAVKGVQATQESELEKERRKAGRSFYEKRMAMIDQMPARNDKEVQAKRDAINVLNSMMPDVAKELMINVNPESHVVSPEQNEYLAGDMDLKTPEEVIEVGEAMGLSDDQKKMALENWRKKKEPAPNVQQTAYNQTVKDIMSNPNRGFWGKAKDYMMLPPSPEYLNRQQSQATPRPDYDQAQRDLWKNVPIIADQLRKQ